MNFQEKWFESAQAKKSLLCVGIDPADPGQRDKNTIPKGLNKLEYCLKVVEDVSPYAAAIKPNRQYLRDFSRKDMTTLTKRIRELGMVSIDDSKIADIGDTNDSAFYHSKLEGYDAITYAPFPGNIEEASKSARKRDIGLITLVLMSNPEFISMKSAIFGEVTGSIFFAKKVAESNGAGIVLGAPSQSNHISIDEIKGIKAQLKDQVILVPGIGAQGGDISPLIDSFGNRIIANVGRAIFYAENPSEIAAEYAEGLRIT